MCGERLNHGVRPGTFPGVRSDSPISLFAPFPLWFGLNL